ncbi:MAG TPA: hypothetical protein GYA08_03805 [Chloroflexi bacterium]|nr:hypothetical protein [Chloroflexota bacterium]
MAPFSVVLSHAELAYLLSLLGAAPLMGVDHNPFDGFNAKEIAVAHATARDALRARDLLRLDAEGHQLVNNDLLHLLEIYTRPDLLITAYRYTTEEDLPLAWFAYRRNSGAAIHTRPGDLLHAFMRAPDAPFVAEALADFCASDVTVSLPASAPLTLPGDVMATARAYADAGQADQVAQVLRTAGLDDVAATALAAELNHPVAVTAITFVATGDNTSARRRDATYWQSTPPAARLIVYTETGAVQISSGGVAEFLAIFNEMV